MQTNARTRWLPLVVLLALTAACGGPPALDPVRPNASAGLTPMVRELIDANIGTVEAAPTSANAHATLGLVYEANEMFEEASRCYANAVELAPEEPRWRYRRAMMLKETGEFDAGVALMLATAEEMPTVAAIHQRLGYDLLDVGRYDEALLSFERVVSLQPERSEGHVGVGEVLVRNGRNEDALPHLRKALESAPGSKPAHYALGLAYRGMGQLDEAERELSLGLNAARSFLPDASSAALRSFTRGYKGILERGDEFIAAGEPARAARELEELLLSYPNDAVVLNNLAAAYLMMKEYGKSLELLDRSMAVDEPQVGAFINASKAHLALGDPAKALRSAEQAIELAPGVGHAYRVKAEAQLAMNDPYGAHGTLLLAIENDPTSFENQMMFGETSFKLNFYEDALLGFTSVVDQKPQFLPGHVNRAMTLMRMERIDEADAALRQAERLAPKHERVAAIRRELDKLK